MLSILAPTLLPTSTKNKDLILCFSHLRWDFVFQRPQHLLTRAARTHNVIYFEEPVFEECRTPSLRVKSAAAAIQVVTPVLAVGTEPSLSAAAQQSLLERLLAATPRQGLITWYYTPMALAFSAHLQPDVCVYDCMDELSAFKNPPAGLAEREAQLFGAADVVFTGGESLYQAKRRRHPRVHAFPSSIDASHFGEARAAVDDPPDQRPVPHPRIGFFGVIDERMDLALVARTAEQLPDVQFVMVGPVVKIDPAMLPQRPNLHWLGGKSYSDLPSYLGNWSAGWMPFALNESTRFISPTKTPEFLAAGLPVVSTAVADVVSPYGRLDLVGIAGSDDMAGKLRVALARNGDRSWLGRVDKFLAGKSWDATWSAMLAQLQSVQTPRHGALVREEA